MKETFLTSAERLKGSEMRTVLHTSCVTLRCLNLNCVQSASSVFSQNIRFFTGKFRWWRLDFKIMDGDTAWQVNKSSNKHQIFIHLIYWTKKHQIQLLDKWILRTFDEVKQYLTSCGFLSITATLAVPHRWRLIDASIDRTSHIAGKCCWGRHWRATAPRWLPR